MRRIATLAVVGVLVLVAIQFALPRILGGDVEDRLTANGGTAEVELGAVPALRLLFGEGDRARVRARGLELPLISPRADVLGSLDGFGEVDVEVVDARAGPVELSEVTLKRADGSLAYRATIDGSVTPRDFAEFAAGQAGGILGGFLGGMASDALPDDPVPIDLDVVLRSENGRPRAVTVDGTVAGLPAGPLAEALAQALAGRF
jgi:hypothetical protein